MVSAGLALAPKSEPDKPPRKGQAAFVLDSFEVEDEWFALELVAFQVLSGEGPPSAIAAEAIETIRRLRLNDEECCGACAEYAEDYWREEITIADVQEMPLRCEETGRSRTALSLLITGDFPRRFVTNAK